MFWLQFSVHGASLIYRRDLHHAPTVIGIELITRFSISTIARKILPNKGIFLFFFINTVVRPLHSKTITVYLCIDQMTDIRIRDTSSS